eukprot:gene27827-30863_t
MAIALGDQCGHLTGLSAISSQAAGNMVRQAAARCRSAGVRMVTSSSAALGWSAMVASNWAL